MQVGAQTCWGKQAHAGVAVIVLVPAVWALVGDRVPQRLHLRVVAAGRVATVAGCTIDALTRPFVVLWPFLGSIPSSAVLLGVMIDVHAPAKPASATIVVAGWIVCRRTTANK